MASGEETLMDRCGVVKNAGSEEVVRTCFLKNGTNRNHLLLDKMPREDRSIAPVIFLPKMHTLNQITRIDQANPNKGHSTKQSACNLQKYQGRESQRKTLSPFQTEGV